MSILLGFLKRHERHIKELQYKSLWLEVDVTYLIFILIKKIYSAFIVLLPLFAF